MVEEIFIPIITIKVCECVEIDFAQICSIWIFPGLRRGFLAPLCERKKLAKTIEKNPDLDDFYTHGWVSKKKNPKLFR